MVEPAWWWAPRAGQRWLALAEAGERRDAEVEGAEVPLPHGTVAKEHLSRQPIREAELKLCGRGWSCQGCAGVPPGAGRDVRRNLMPRVRKTRQMQAQRRRPGRMVEV